VNNEKRNKHTIIILAAVALSIVVCVAICGFAMQNVFSGSIDAIVIKVSCPYCGHVQDVQFTGEVVYFHCDACGEYLKVG